MSGRLRGAQKRAPARNAGKLRRPHPPTRAPDPPPYQKKEVTAVVVGSVLTSMLWSLGQTGAAPCDGLTKANRCRIRAMGGIGHQRPARCAGGKPRPAETAARNPAGRGANDR